ncbi:hypothetical protein V8E53_001478 [Lactarius tabidus]
MTWSDRAAKTAALKNRVWRNGKEPSSKSGTQKCPRSPDTSSSAGTKKMRSASDVSSKKDQVPKNLNTNPGRRADTEHLLLAESRRKPVPIDVDSDQEDHGNKIDLDDAGNSGNERPNRDMDSDSEGQAGEDNDDLGGLDPSLICAALEKERVEWAVANSYTGGTPEDSSCNSATGSCKAKRLAEVPQWEGTPNTDADDTDPVDADQSTTDPANADPTEVASTCKGSGSPFLSEEEISGEDEDDEQASLDADANIGWSLSCHFTPAASSLRMINILSQPSDLRAIIRAAIYRVTADAIHETAYRPADSLTSYYHLILLRSAKSLRFMPYAKRFSQDEEFTKAITRVLNGCVSNYRKQVRKNAVNKVEGFYGLLDSEGCIEKVNDLILGSTYIYLTKKLADYGEKPLRSKPFFHPAIIAILWESFFSIIRGGSLATKYHNHFTSSLPDQAPTELEIPGAMLTLVATSIHSVLDDYRTTGFRRKMEFNADLYEDVYLCHMTFLSHIQEGSAAKYHRMMADLYTQAS